MIRPSDRNSRSFRLICVLAVAALPWAMPALGMTKLQELPPLPIVMEKYEPEYPVSRWLAGDGGWVTLEIEIDATGAVTSIKPREGDDPWTDLSIQAMRQWKYAPARTGSGPVASHTDKSFYFEPVEAVFLEDESRIVSVAPQPLVPVPFCRGIDSVDGPKVDLIQVHVDRAGFVGEVRFAGEAPPDSTAIRAIAKRWIFRPFIATDGRNKGTPVHVWATIEVRRSCGPSDAGEFARPDSLLLAQLDAATTATFCLFRPSGRKEQTIAGPLERRQDALTRVSSEVVGGWTVPADSIVPALRSFLLQEQSYRGASPLKSRQLPEPEFGLLVDYVHGTEGITVLVSPKAEVLHVWTPRGLLEVPYGRNGRDFVARLRGFIPPAAPAIPSGP